MRNTKKFSTTKWKELKKFKPKTKWEKMLLEDEKKREST